MNKCEQRKLYKSIRDSITFAEKSDYDMRIFNAVKSFDLYKKCEILLAYISFGSETDTQRIINYSLSFDKRVAVPYCDGKKMLFYEISNLSELIIGKFGIPTVDVKNKTPIADFDKALCIVPAVCFDLKGSRIGYGGGYYDRFLSEHSVVSLGISSEKCVCTEIIDEIHDMKVDYLITDKYFRNFKKREVSTYE